MHHSVALKTAIPAFLAGMILVINSASAAVECRNPAISAYSPTGLVAYTTKSAARNAAVQAWIGKCTAAMGAMLSSGCDWAIARDKKEACNRVPSGFGGYNHKCTVSAVPCINTLN